MGVCAFVCVCVEGKGGVRRGWGWGGRGGGERKAGGERGREEKRIAGCRSRGKLDRDRRDLARFM